MRELTNSPRFIGFVHVRVGQELIALAVQAVSLRHDGGAAAPGGFFQDAISGDFGILVDSEASEPQAKEQLDQAIADAVAHISRRILN